MLFGVGERDGLDAAAAWLTREGHQTLTYALRQRSRVSVVLVLQTMTVPVSVTPGAPAVEQNAPGCTVPTVERWAVVRGAAGGAACGAGAATVTRPAVTRGMDAVFGAALAAVCTAVLGAVVDARGDDEARAANVGELVGVGDGVETDVLGSVADSLVVTGDGAVAPTTASAVTTPSGAATRAPSDTRRLVARPFRQRRYAKNAGTNASRHSRKPNAAVAGMIASKAPRITTANVTAPSRLRGPGDGVIARPSKRNPGFRSHAIIGTCAISLTVPGVSGARHCRLYMPPGHEDDIDGLEAAEAGMLAELLARATRIIAQGRRPTPRLTEALLLLPAHQSVETRFERATRRRCDPVSKFFQYADGLLRIVTDHRGKLPTTPANPTGLDHIERTVLSVEAEVDYQELKDVLKTRTHASTANREVDVGYLAGVPRSVAKQELAHRRPFGVDVPMAARSTVHRLVEVQTEQGKSVLDPHNERGFRHRWIPVHRVGDQADVDQQLSSLPSLGEERNGLRRLTVRCPDLNCERQPSGGHGYLPCCRVHSRLIGKNAVQQLLKFLSEVARFLL